MKREGRHLSVRSGKDEVYRVTRQHDGHWVWCDLYGNHGGDNIDLVREIEPSTGYADAVYRLLGSPTVLPRQQQPIKRIPPRLPTAGADAKGRGRSYLMGRGISLDTIEHAEACGMVRYAEGGVLFVGYDASGTVQNVTRRATSTKDPVQKRDLRGSDKSYSPILPGDPAQVWIVEGGVDALAVHDMARRRGERPPTVIVSGGAHVRGFLDREHVQNILRRAKHVTVALDNEKSQEVQAKTDDGHKRQALLIEQITGRAVGYWKPKYGKDAADVNLREIEEERQRQRERQENGRMRGPTLDL